MAAIDTQPAMPSLMPDEQPISGFNAWFASRMSKTRGVKGSMRGMSNLGGPWAGKTPEEARQLAMEEYAALPDQEKMQWESRASGEQLRPGGAMPFESVSTGRMGKPLVSGASPTAAARKAEMDSAAASLAKAAKDAVASRKAWQDANPAAVVDMNIAAKSENLAKSGITDMGGGKMAMSNRYGTGYVEMLTPEQMATRKPGTIIDEKGVVDVSAMMANKGQGTTVPYKTGTTATPALNMDAGDQIRQGIAAKVAAAAPGAAERLAADRNRMLSAMPSAKPATAAAPVQPAAAPSALPAMPPAVKTAAKQAAPHVARAAASVISPILPAAYDAAQRFKR